MHEPFIPRIAWVTRSFLDYRVPVFAEVDRLVGGRLFLIFSGDFVPNSIQDKLTRLFGDRALAMQDEWKLGPEDRDSMANQNVSLRLQPGLIRRIRSVRPDVMVCDGFFKWTLPAMIYRIAAGVPLVVNYERTKHTERNAQWFRTFYRRLAVKAIDAMNCNGRLSKEYTISLGMPAKRILTGNLAADSEGLASRARAVGPDEVDNLRRRLGVDGLLCTYVGGLNPRKGVRELVRAWQRFEQRHPRFGTLLLVGDGDLEEDLRLFCAEQSISTVRFAGSVAYDDIAPYYAASDVFLIATLEDNWSLVVPEAMSCGLPVVCSMYNGCWPELVREDENGWVFDPLDGDSFGKALDRLVQEKHKLKEMGRRSIEIVKEGHTPQHAAQRILETCQIAIDHRSPNNGAARSSE